MKYRLVCFDIDGILVLEHKERLLAHAGYHEPHEFEDSIWVTMHRYFGVGKEAKEQYAQYHAGMISYAQWVSMNIALWKEKGADQKSISNVFEEFTIPMPGAKDTIAALKEKGIALAVVSGGFKELALFHFPGAFSRIYANDITYDNDGNIVGSHATPYDFGGKLTGVKRICEELGITIQETVFIGDNINDFQVMEEVGLGIAFNSKSEALSKAADVIISKLDLREVLPHIIGKDQ